MQLPQPVHHRQEGQLLGQRQTRRQHRQPTIGVELGRTFRGEPGLADAGIADHHSRRSAANARTEQTQLRCTAGERTNPTHTTRPATPDARVNPQAATDRDRRRRTRRNFSTD